MVIIKKPMSIAATPEFRELLDNVKPDDVSMSKVVEVLVRKGIENLEEDESIYEMED